MIWLNFGQIKCYLLVLFIFQIEHKAALHFDHFLVEHPVQVGFFERVNLCFLTKAPAHFVNDADEVVNIRLEHHDLR